MSRAAIGIVVLAALGGVALVSRKSSASGPVAPGPRGTTDPRAPSPNLPNLPAPPHDLEIDAAFTLRDGDLPAYMAHYYTGDGQRFHELATLNSMKLGNPADQAASGWHAGRRVVLPGSWRPFSRPLPRPGTSMKPTVPAVFPVPANPLRTS